MKPMIILFVLLLAASPSFSEDITVKIKGVDDGRKTTKQNDYKEAVLDAKLKAIERAGLEIQSITKIINFQLKYKAVESRADAVLLPGFDILDIGYLTDGTYQVVLIGKVKTIEEGIDTKELRYGKSLIERDKRHEAKKIIDNIIKNSKSDDAIAEALYFSVIWGFAGNDRETLEKLKAYYPKFKRLNHLESIVKKREAEKERKRLEAMITPSGYTRSGIDWHEKRDHDRAIRDFNKAIELDPKYAKAYYWRGLVWFWEDDYDRAMKEFNKVIELGKEHSSDAYYYRACIWKVRHDYDRCIKDCTKAIELYPFPEYRPGPWKIYETRGYCWVKKKEYYRACRDWKKACELGRCRALERSKSICK